MCRIFFLSSPLRPSHQGVSFPLLTPYTQNCKDFLVCWCVFSRPSSYEGGLNSLVRMQQSIHTPFPCGIWQCVLQCNVCFLFHRALWSCSVMASKVTVWRKFRSLWRKDSILIMSIRRLEVCSVFFCFDFSGRFLGCPWCSVVGLYTWSM